MRSSPPIPRRWPSIAPGKEKAFNFLVGQAMKASKGKANPAQVSEILTRKLLLASRPSSAGLCGPSRLALLTTRGPQRLCVSAGDL